MAKTKCVYHEGKLPPEYFIKLFALKEMCYREAEAAMSNTKPSAYSALSSISSSVRANNMRDVATSKTLGLNVPQVSM